MATRPTSFQQFQAQIPQRPSVPRITLPAGSGSNPGSVNGIPNIPSVQDNAIGTAAAINDARRAGFVYQPMNPIGGGSPNEPRNVYASGGGGGSRGGGGGGGGGGSAGPGAAVSGAYQAYLEWLRSQNGDFLKDQGLIDALGATGALDQRVNNYRQAGQGAFDNAMGQINGMANQGNQRLAEIVSALSQRLGGARADVQGVFQNNANDIQGLAAQAQGRAGQVADQVGASAAAFGFDPATDVQGLGDLASALAAQQQARSAAYNAAYADRQNVYGGLQADVSRSILDRQGALGGQATQALQALMNQAGSAQLQGQEEARLRALQEQARQSQAAAQFNQGNQQNVYQLMLEMAQQGVNPV